MELEEEKSELKKKKTLSIKKKLDTDALKKVYVESHGNNLEVIVKANKSQNANNKEQKTEHPTNSFALTEAEYHKRLEVLKRSNDLNEKNTKLHKAVTVLDSIEQVSKEESLNNDSHSNNDLSNNQSLNNDSTDNFADHINSTDVTSSEKTKELSVKEPVINFKNNDNGFTSSKPHDGDERKMTSKSENNIVSSRKDEAMATEVNQTSKNETSSQVKGIDQADKSVPESAETKRINAILELKKKSDKIRNQKEDEEFEQLEEIDRKKKLKLKAAKQDNKFSSGQKRLDKHKIFKLLEGSDDDFKSGGKKYDYKKRNRNNFNAKIEKVYKEILISESNSVSELANAMGEKSTDVIRELMKLGVLVSSSGFVDKDTAEVVISSFGHNVKFVKDCTVDSIIEERLEKSTNLIPRHPVVTIMGHVDHGKTSLLDALRQTDVVSREVGGITQHIGAYLVNLENGRKITFIDTPGHEAFTAMRSRGASVTDIVVLVVSADDGIMTQTIEAINHAKAAKVPIIVAINKIDKPDADPEKVKNELLQHGLIPEDYGGDVMTVPISALKKINLDKLEESILLVGDMMELKSDPSIEASGIVVESRVDKKQGILATFLIQYGTLKVGDIVAVGHTYGKVKALMNDKGKKTDMAIPSVPIEVVGLNETPIAGDKFVVVDSEKVARDLSEKHKEIIKSKCSIKKISMDDLFSSSGKIKTLKLIIKADVQGSIEAINSGILKIEHEELKIEILHSGVGLITDSDVILAEASNAIIIGFNSRPLNSAAILAERNNVVIRHYSIIYEIVTYIKEIASGMLSEIVSEKYLGSVEIRAVFNITKYGKIAGSYVTKGLLKRGCALKLYRDNEMIHEGKLKTLKRMKDEVKEVKENFECGIAIENYEDIKVGDRIDAFEIISKKQVIE